jgi:hypothetical protein
MATRFLRSGICNPPIIPPNGTFHPMARLAGRNTRQSVKRTRNDTEEDGRQRTKPASASGRRQTAKPILSESEPDDDNSNLEREDDSHDAYVSDTDGLENAPAHMRNAFRKELSPGGRDADTEADFVTETNSRLGLLLERGYRIQPVGAGNKHIIQPLSATECITYVYVTDEPIQRNKITPSPSSVTQKRKLSSLASSPSCRIGNNRTGSPSARMPQLGRSHSALSDITTDNLSVTSAASLQKRRKAAETESLHSSVHQDQCEDTFVDVEETTKKHCQLIMSRNYLTKDPFASEVEKMEWALKAAMTYRGLMKRGRKYALGETLDKNVRAVRKL